MSPATLPTQKTLPTILPQMRAEPSSKPLPSGELVPSEFLETFIALEEDRDVNTKAKVTEGAKEASISEVIESKSQDDLSNSTEIETVLKSPKNEVAHEIESKNLATIHQNPTITDCRSKPPVSRAIERSSSEHLQDGYKTTGTEIGTTLPVQHLDIGDETTTFESGLFVRNSKASIPENIDQRGADENAIAVSEVLKLPQNEVPKLPQPMDRAGPIYEGKASFESGVTPKISRGLDSDAMGLPVTPIKMPTDQRQQPSTSKTVAPETVLPQTEPSRFEPQITSKDSTPVPRIHTLTADETRVENAAPKNTSSVASGGQSNPLMETGKAQNLGALPMIQTLNYAGIEDEKLMFSGVMLDGLESQSSPQRMTWLQTTQPATPQENARAIAVQISAHLHKAQNGNIELTLSPEELGRVRIGFNHSDAGMVISVVAERPETLDLMRRHVAILEQEFRDIGQGGVSFSFEQNGSNEHDDSAQNKGTWIAAPLTNPVEEPEIHPPQQSTISVGLDLRL